MKTITFYVKGMHCNACKLLLEKSLIQLSNLHAIDANVRKGTIKLRYEKTLNKDEIASVIRECGYELVEEQVIRPWLSTNRKDYVIALVSLISFLLVYMILKHT
jgi:Cu+-exporting ATPase